MSATIIKTPGSAPAFSTTSQLCVRKRNGDRNKKRGVSSLYRSGPREPLSMSDVPLPRPREFKVELKVDDSHPLWGFFPAPGKLLWTPEETEQHGRAWTVEELRKKSWEDLHALWWVCCRERNMLATSAAELSNGKIGFGKQEIEIRDEEVRKTMRAIKHTLTERYYTWEDAQAVAQSDPEIDFNAKDGNIFKPQTYEEEQEPVVGNEEEAAAATTRPATTPIATDLPPEQLERKPEVLH